MHNVRPRLRGPALGAVVTCVALLSVACVRPHPPVPPPPPPTTVRPTTTTTSTTSTTTSTTTTSTTSTTSTTLAPTPCQADLSAFLAQANAGTWTTPASLVELTGATPLDNPATSGDTGGSSTETITAVVHDADGDVLTPSPTMPLIVNVHGTRGRVTSPQQVGPTADPLTVRVESASAITLLYDGGYLATPLTVQAFLATPDTNPCTNTLSYSLGAVTVPLGNLVTSTGTAAAALPAACASGAAGTCADEAVTSGIKLSAAVGYAAGSLVDGTPVAGTTPSSGEMDDFTVDTGSIGVAVPVAELGPNAVGPAGPAYKWYDSSGFEYVGYLYLAPLTIRTAGGGDVTTVPVRVLGVVSSGCYPNVCVHPPDPTVFHYLGVGFDRNTPAAADPLASPTDNALLQVVSTPGGGEVAPGFIVGGTGVQVGLDAAQTAGFSSVPLTASAAVPGDWSTAPGFVSITGHGGTPVPVAGTALLDTGITEMFIGSPNGTFKELAPDDSVGIEFGTSSTSPELGYSFGVGIGRDPDPVGMAPSQVSKVGGLGVFVNTGRHPLFQQDYLVDARHGCIGFLALASPLR